MTTSNPHREDFNGPTARPTAHKQESLSGPVSAISGPLATPKQSPLTGATSPTRPAARRVGRAMRRTLANQLSDADWSVLSDLNRYRFLQTHQLQALSRSDGPTEARALRRQLLRLTRTRLIQPVTDRRVGGLTGGADPNIWQLTAAGKAVLTGGLPGRTSSYPSTRFLTHTLATAQTAIGLQKAADSLGGSIDIQLERDAARQIPNTGGGHTRLTPDLFAIVRAADDTGLFEDTWFVEVDCATESLPTLLRKCEQYEAYRRSGLEQLDRGVFPLVLWVFYGTTARKRIDELRQRIERGRGFTNAMYRYATPDQLTDVLSGGGL